MTALTVETMTAIKMSQLIDLPITAETASITRLMESKDVTSDPP
jgi:hypothetical protein